MTRNFGSLKGEKKYDLRRSGGLKLSLSTVKVSDITGRNWLGDELQKLSI